MIAKNIELNQLTHKVKAFKYDLGRAHSIEHFQLNHTNPGASKRVEKSTSETRKFEINALDDIFNGFGLTQKQKY